MIKIYYVRHGETEQNKQGILTGRKDIKLNEVGRKQAVETAEKLRYEKFDIAFHSPLLRAKETAEIINKYHNLDFVVDERIVERDYGDFTGKTTSEIDRNISWNYYLDYTKYPNIEHVRDVFERVYSFIDYIKHNYKNKTILVVAHSGVGRAFDCYFNGIPEDGSLLDKGIKNAAIVDYEIK